MSGSTTTGATGSGFEAGYQAWRRGRSAYESAAGRVRSVSGLLTVLAGLVPVARRLVRWVQVLAVASAVAVLVIVGAPLLLGWPPLAGWAVLAVALVAMGWAPAVLWLFADALDEILALPAWLRASPAIVRDHGGELADLVAQARSDQAAGRRRRVHTVRDGWRAGRMLLAAHAEVPGYGAALKLVSVPFLIAVALGALVGVAEIVLAPAVLVTVAVLHLV